MDKVSMHGIFRWLNSFPELSRHRLFQINNASNSAGHIVLSLGYGFCDSNIRQLNRLIIGLMLTRMRAERAGRLAVVANINNTLTILHESVNRVTGTAPALSSMNCQSPVKSSFAMERTRLVQ